MKGFKLNEDEIYDMLHVLKEELEEYIGEFEGEISIDLYEYYHSVVISFDNEKYVCSDAVVRKIKEFFEQSQFDIDEFKIEDDFVYKIYIKFKNGA